MKSNWSSEEGNPCLCKHTGGFLPAKPHCLYGSPTYEKKTRVLFELETASTKGRRRCVQASIDQNMA